MAKPSCRHASYTAIDAQLARFMDRRPGSIGSQASARFREGRISNA